MPEIEWNLRGEVIESDEWEDVDKVWCTADVRDTPGDLDPRLHGYTCHIAALEERENDVEQVHFGEVETRDFEMRSGEANSMTHTEQVILKPSDGECQFERIETRESGASSMEMSKLVCE